MCIYNAEMQESPRHEGGSEFSIANFVNSTSGASTNGVSALNCIELYFTNDDKNKQRRAGWKSIRFTSQWNGAISTQMLQEYHNRDLVYIYDLRNDAQKVVRKSFRAENCKMQNIHVIGYDEEVAPPHRFPCTSDLSHTANIERTIFRINSRMYLYIDKCAAADDGSSADGAGAGDVHYIYIHYNHADTVEIVRMQSDLSRALNWIRRNVTMVPIC